MCVRVHVHVAVYQISLGHNDMRMAVSICMCPYIHMQILVLHYRAMHIVWLYAMSQCTEFINVLLASAESMVFCYGQCTESFTIAQNHTIFIQNLPLKYSEAKNCTCIDCTAEDLLHPILETLLT